MTEFIASVTSFSVDGPLVNVFRALEPFAEVSGALKTLINLSPMK